MHIVYICPGVYILNVSELGLNVLCGCPMDSSKLLIRKGIIREIEKDGVRFETGPNAILISDKLTQNGQFSNLIEFPVMQMQYNQGMCLPNHPNNTGARPLLIGMRSQIYAQCNYFLRGKYGLFSVKELMEAGFEEEEAKKLMRLKMRFNFGYMDKIEKLFDLLYIEDSEYQKVYEGLYVKRISFNIYEFTLEYEAIKETIQINLNLRPQERYELPYDFDNYRIKPAYFSVIHLGEANGWDPNRPCMSSLICYQGRYFLVDAPPGVEKLLKAIGLSVNEIEGIFHTHCHDDHFAGITSLIRSSRRIKYFATRAVRHSVMKKLSSLLSIEHRMFFRMFDCFDMEFDQWNNIDGLEVKPIFSPHPVETSIFYFRTLCDCEEGYRSYAHWADICSSRILKSFITDDPNSYGISEEYYSQIEESYLLPADIKKIDIGGGLIHGEAIDFKDDTSKKIVLCHLNRPLDCSEKEIGTNANFAMNDILIHSKIDFNMQRAEKWLREIIPSITKADMTLLLNSPIVDLNVGNIILKNGEKPEYIYLLLTGEVTGNSSKDSVSIYLHAGVLIGFASLILDRPVDQTFRTENYVTVLKIPKDILLHILKKHGLEENLKKSQHYIDYLLSLDLFYCNIDISIIHSIIQSLTIRESQPGELIDCLKHPGLYIVYKGSLSIEEENGRLLTDGDVFGEETVLFGMDVKYTYQTVEKTTIYHIPDSLIHYIPVLQ